MSSPTHETSLDEQGFNEPIDQKWRCGSVVPWPLISQAGFIYLSLRHFKENATSKNYSIIGFLVGGAVSVPLIPDSSLLTAAAVGLFSSVLLPLMGVFTFATPLKRAEIFLQDQSHVWSQELLRRGANPAELLQTEPFHSALHTISPDSVETYLSSQWAKDPQKTLTQKPLKSKGVLAPAFNRLCIRLGYFTLLLLPKGLHHKRQLEAHSKAYDQRGNLLSAALTPYFLAKSERAILEKTLDPSATKFLDAHFKHAEHQLRPQEPLNRTKQHRL